MILRNRLVGLDFWRSILLLYGVLLHTAGRVRLIPDDPWIFGVIQSLSRATRMQAFFLIAGYLAAASIRKKGAAEWLRGRTAQLMIPLFVVWITFQRLTDLVKRGDPFATPLNIDHLWFLLVLMAFSLLTAASKSDSVDSLIAWVIRHLDKVPVASVITGMIAAVFAGTILNQYVYVGFPAIGMKEGSFESLYLMSRAFVMVVFYVAGHVLHESNLLGRTAAAPLFAIAAIGMMLYLLLYDPNTYTARQIAGIPDEASKVVLYLLYSVIGTCFSLGVFIQARSITRVSNATMQLSKSAYTIYLVHIFYVAAAFELLSQYTRNHYLLFGGIVLTATAFSIVTHQVISKVPVLQLLFNGKLPRTKAEQPPAPDVPPGVEHLSPGARAR